MITDKTLKVLGGVAAVLVVLSAWVGSSQPTVTFAFNRGQPLVSDPDPDRIDSLEIQKGEETVKIRRAGKSFVVESLKNYPAATREVNTLMRSVLGIRCAARVSEDPDTHAELRVAEGGAESTTVQFLDADGNAVVGVVVSDSKDGEQFARLIGEDGVYRVEESVSLRTAGLDFVDKKLVELARDRIESASVAPAEGVVYSIVSPEAGTVELQAIPDGKKAKGTEPDGVFGAATYLNFTDFKSESEIEGLEFGNRYTVQSRDGAEYSFELAKQDEKWWIRGSARYLGPERITVPELPPDATEEQQQENQRQLEQNVRYRDAQAAVNEFNERHQSWVYEVSSWKAESMTKPFEDLLEDDDGRPEKITASHVLIAWQGLSSAGEDVTRTKEEARTRAEEVLAKALADPESFADLAREYSDGPTGPDGGDLNEFDQNTMAPPFTEAAFALPVGEISDIVETEFGFHVIKRTK